LVFSVGVRGEGAASLHEEREPVRSVVTVIVFHNIRKKPATAVGFHVTVDTIALNSVYATLCARFACFDGLAALA